MPLNRPISRNVDIFGYNERGEVVSSRIDIVNAEDAYAYDNIGNLLYSADHSATNTYVSSNRNQYTSILRESVSCEPIYDLDGNMTQHGDWTYNFDAGNRLISVSSKDTLVATFAYDAQGRRVKKVTADGTHRYFYDGWLLVYEHIIRPNCTTNEIEYVWGKDISGTCGGAAGIGGLLYLKRDGAIYVPWYDAYGNILGYRDAQLNVIAQYAYDAFGKTIAQSGSMSDTFSLRYSTKYYDSETDLYYYGYRYYNPQIMCWLSEDPIEEEGGLNLYTFCMNSSLCMFDPLDDMLAALGRFNLRMAVSGYVKEKCAFIASVGVYVRDSYDFVGDQSLGYWNSQTNYAGKNFLRGDKVSNASFREYTAKTGKGADFLVYSDIKVTRLEKAEKIVLSP